MKKVGWKEFGFFIGVYALIILIQLIGGYFSVNSLQNWYYALQKAPWTPPSWVFGPAWTILYLFMTIAIWFIYLSDGKRLNKQICYTLFFLQLFVNFLWTIFFFGMKSPLLGLLDIIVLIGLILANIFFYYRVNKVSAWLMLPYLLWVCFAFTLNLSIIIDN